MFMEVGYFNSTLRDHHQTLDFYSPALFLGFLQVSMPMDQVQEAREQPESPPTFCLFAWLCLGSKLVKINASNIRQSTCHSEANVICSTCDFNITTPIKVFFSKRITSFHI